MEHSLEKGLYGTGNVFRFYSTDGLEEHSDNPIWKDVINSFKSILGKTWKQGSKLWRIIGLEDNQAWLDYYYILEDENKNKLYKLVCTDFYKYIICLNQK